MGCVIAATAAASAGTVGAFTPVRADAPASRARPRSDQAVTARFDALTAEQQLAALRSTVASENPRGCPRVTISGRTHRRNLVTVALRFRYGRPLGVTRADRHGHFSVRACRGAAETSYRRNGHKLTYQVFSGPWRGGGVERMRDVTTPLVHPRSLMVRGHWVTPRRFKGPLSTRSASAARGGAGVAIAYPTVMHLEAIRAARVVSYEYSTETGAGFSEKVAVDIGGFGVAGGAGQSTTTSNGLVARPWVLKKGKRWGARDVIAPQRIEPYTVAVYADRTAIELDRPSAYYRGTRSTWTHHLRLRRAPYLSCAEGRSRLHFYSNKSVKAFPSSHTAEFHASASVSGFGEFEYSARFGATTGYAIHLADPKTHGVHHYCVSGNRSSMSASQDILISERATKPGGGCRILAPKGPIPCRTAAREH